VSPSPRRLWSEFQTTGPGPPHWSLSLSNIGHPPLSDFCPTCPSSPSVPPRGANTHGRPTFEQPDPRSAHEELFAHDFTRELAKVERLQRLSNGFHGRARVDPGVARRRLDAIQRPQIDRHRLLPLPGSWNNETTIRSLSLSNIGQPPCPIFVRVVRVRPVPAHHGRAPLAARLLSNSLREILWADSRRRTTLSVGGTLSQIKTSTRSQRPQRTSRGPKNA